jgi:hypothetical protein
VIGVLGGLTKTHSAWLAETKKKENIRVVSVAEWQLNKGALLSDSMRLSWHVSDKQRREKRNHRGEEREREEGSSKRDEKD